MYIYNVTINVEGSIADYWITWMKKEHIPRVMETGKFVNYKFLKLLNESPDVEGLTFAVQYMSDSLKKLEEYLNDYAPSMQKEQFDMYQSKCVTFRTVLEEI